MQKLEKFRKINFCEWQKWENFARLIREKGIFQLCNECKKSNILKKWFVMKIIKHVQCVSWRIFGFPYILFIFVISICFFWVRYESSFSWSSRHTASIFVLTGIKFSIIKGSISWKGSMFGNFLLPSFKASYTSVFPSI